jgi:uncharacterized phage protein gp47/JayE
LAAQITLTGVVAPVYNDILESLKASFSSIYGSDRDLDADTQDGQLLAIFAKAISDCNDSTKAVYASFSPNGAVGVGLSANVKINGIQRIPATYSTATLVLTGQTGTTILNGVARDINNQNWLLPSTVTIPPGGSVTVTATAQNAGPVQAAPNEIRILGTPVAGWSTVSNPADAAVGKLAETDAALRQRQTISTSHGNSLLAAIVEAVENVTGVQQVHSYENVTSVTDSNGLPGHSFALVVMGGDATQIATAIMGKKGPGPATYGSTTINLVDSVGETEAISFTIPTEYDIDVAIDLNALTGYTTDVGLKIKNAINAYIAKIQIGSVIYWSRLFQPALLLVDANGQPLATPDPDALTYEINTLRICVHGGTLGTANLPLGFAQAGRAQISNIALTVH